MFSQIRKYCFSKKKNSAVKFQKFIQNKINFKSTYTPNAKTISVYKTTENQFLLHTQYLYVKYKPKILNRNGEKSSFTSLTIMHEYVLHFSTNINDGINQANQNRGC